MYSVVGFVSTDRCVQVAQLSQRDRAAGWVSFSQKWKTGMGRQYFADIVGLSSTSVMLIGQQTYRIRWKKQNKGYYAVQGHRGR